GVLLDELLVGAAQPLTGDREATVALDLWDAGLLQQRQRHAASANEDEIGGDDGGVAGVTVLDGDLPLRALALKVDDLTAVAHLDALGGQPIDVLAGQRTVVDVSTLIEPGNCGRSVEVATLRTQRTELTVHRLRFRKLHVWANQVNHYELL